MSLCYDFQKWIIVSLASVTISLTIGLAIFVGAAHGYVDGNNNGKDDVEEWWNASHLYANDQVRRYDDCIRHEGQWNGSSCHLKVPHGQTVDNQTTLDTTHGQTVDNQTTIDTTHGQTVDNQTTIDTIEFSISVPDNWAYQRGIYSQLGLTPNEFGAILVNAFEGVNEELKDGGVYAEFRYAWYYPIKNAPFDTFVKYEIDKNLHGFSITSKQNVTIDNEPAVKMYADGIAEGKYLITDYTGIKSVLYWVWHDEKPYTLEYTASVKDFEKYLPQFEQMVKSFKFTS